MNKLELFEYLSSLEGEQLRIAEFISGYHVVLNYTTGVEELDRL